jgi:hypothetical protein
MGWMCVQTPYPAKEEPDEANGKEESENVSGRDSLPTEGESIE